MVGKKVRLQNNQFLCAKKIRNVTIVLSQIAVLDMQYLTLNQYIVKMGQDNILEFLKKHSSVNKMFTVTELAKNVGVNTHSASISCRKLRNQGYIQYVIAKAGDGNIDHYKYYYKSMRFSRWIMKK